MVGVRKRWRRGHTCGYGIDVGAMVQRKQEEILVTGGVVSATAAAVSIVLRAMTGTELCYGYKNIEWHQHVAPACVCSETD